MTFGSKATSHTKQLNSRSRFNSQERYEIRLTECQLFFALQKVGGSRIEESRSRELGIERLRIEMGTPAFGLLDTIKPSITDPVAFPGSRFFLLLSVSRFSQQSAPAFFSILLSRLSALLSVSRFSKQSVPALFLILLSRFSIRVRS